MQLAAMHSKTQHEAASSTSALRLLTSLAGHGTPSSISLQYCSTSDPTTSRSSELTGSFSLFFFLCVYGINALFCNEMSVSSR